VDFIAQDDQPLSISDSPSFRRLCAVLNKSIVIPGRTKMSELVEQRYYELKEHVKSALKQAESVNITTDTATTIAQHALQAVTVHYIDSSWRMRSALLENAPIPERHTAENLQELIKTTLQNWDIGSKVFAATTDAAANMHKCTRDMQEAEQIEEGLRCFCHCLQLAVKTAIEQSDEIQGAIDAAKAIVRYFKTSNIAAEALRSAQTDAKVAYLELCEEKHVNPDASEYAVRPLKLIQDVCTRWSSTHMMCSRIVLLREHVSGVLKDLDQDIDLTALQWQELAELVQILEPCAEAIRLMEGEKYPTLSHVIPLVLMVSAMLKGKSAEQPGMPDFTDFTSAVNQVRRRILQEMNVPGRFDHFSRSARFACALDPRYKHLSFLTAPERDSIFQQIASYYRHHYPAPAPNPIPAPAAEPDISKPAQPAPGGQSLFHPLSLSALLRFSFKPSSELLNIEIEIQSFRASPSSSDDDPLDWWRLHQLLFPNLAKLARKFLAIPASSAPSERAFSKVGIVVDKLRSRLLPEKANQLVFLKHNVRNKT